MSSSREVLSAHRLEDDFFEEHHFIITLTNYPRLLERTEQYHGYDILVQNQNGRYHRRRRDDTLAHEIILYNDLKHELEQAIRAYLQRTRQSFPINFVFDFSHIDIEH